MHYNFCRVHMTLNTTPAVGAGVADHVWTIAEFAAMVEARENAKIEAGAMKRGGSYKKKYSN
jgi:hypothetical protein